MIEYILQYKLNKCVHRNHKKGILKLNEFNFKQIFY